MAVKKSHFRPSLSGALPGISQNGARVIRIICVLAAISVPAALALRGAWSLGTGVVAVQSQDNELLRNQEIRGETRALSDEILNEIELVKTRTIAAVELDGLQVLGDSSIIAAAETTRGVFLPGFLKSDLQTEIPKISKRDIEFSGLSLFQVEIKTSDGGKSLGIAFNQGARKYLAVVNPLLAFQGVSTWSNGREGELLRGYMIDDHGKVLIHSEKALNGTDFSKEELFQRAIGPVFRGQRIGGVGIFAGARVSYLKLRSLPYVIVVERVLHGGFTPNASQRLNSILRDLRTPLFSMFSVVVLACFGSIWIVLMAFNELPRFRKREPVARPPRVDDEVLNDFTAEQLKKAELEFAEKTKEIEFLRGSLNRRNPDLDSRKPS